VTEKLSQSITTQELMAIDFRYNFTNEELEEDWKKLVKAKDFKLGSQYKPAMKLCQHFCPNFWHIQNERGESFSQAWQNYEIMDKVRKWGLQGMSQLWLSWIRRAVFMAAGLPNSSFYRPHFSKQIAMMTGKTTGTLFDPCFGWGGRMLGTVANDWNYIGCDPNKETYDNVNKILEFIKSKNLLHFPKVNLHNIPAEDYDFQNSEKVDIILTSPPYFNLEIYNDNDNQSYNKHDTYESWRDNWLYPLIQNCFSILNDDGLSAWNVMNFKRYDLVGDIIKIHENNGFKLVNTVGFQSPLSNIRKLKNKDITYIFRKLVSTH
jgi:hypothetical protein